MLADDPPGQSQVFVSSDMFVDSLGIVPKLPFSSCWRCQWMNDLASLGPPRRYQALCVELRIGFGLYDIPYDVAARVNASQQPAIQPGYYIYITIDR